MEDKRLEKLYKLSICFCTVFIIKDDFRYIKNDEIFDCLSLIASVFSHQMFLNYTEEEIQKSLIKSMPDLSPEKYKEIFKKMKILNKYYPSILND